MENLQLQDAFTPYYAGRQDEQEQSAGHAQMGHSSDGNVVSMAEVKARLERCRNLLARAVAADAQRN